MTKNIKQFYEKYHKEKIYNPVAQFMFREKTRFLKNLLKNSKGKILIIGCGSEDDMEIIPANCEGIGIDISEEAIEQSQEKYPRFKYYVANATNMPFDENSFDYVVCSEVIEHIPNNEKVLSEIKRILKNKGTFIVTTPNWINWYGLARKIGESVTKKPFTSGDQPIDNWSTPGSLKKKLIKHNFNIRKFKGLWYYPPFGKGKRQIPHQITLPLVKILYPLEILSRHIIPWFGHMIVYETKLKKDS